ncbi:ABC transporter permease [Actinosynnema sp. NPDC047251]|uniref:Putative secreted protein n=1 Tax=Saccharothrix espanaensis (strain ATCC 51144 / DSM 44229 / JCM 9112 / NBRC 15066 / NRRL 15764) TaxID=1179773 RepID=K0JQJ9_SACES|nr:ABC transporter permease [Saccharothrix espanaensis]CCH29640.1 putative secreted protein [Saccharothrix espanaensis DSM 44229]
MTLSGGVRSALVIAGQGIRAHKLRTFLSVLSLFLGVLAVLTVQAGAEIAERAVVGGVELTRGRDGTLLMRVPERGSAPEIVERTLTGRSDGVATSGLRAVVGEPGVRPINDGGGPFDRPRGGNRCPEPGCTGADREADGQAIEVTLRAVTGDVRVFRPFRTVSGQWLDFTAAPSLAPGIVLNEEAAKGLRQYRIPAELSVPGASAHLTPRVLGVVADGQAEPTAYLRTDELRAWLPRTPEVDPARGGSSIEVLFSPDAGELARTLSARLVAAGVDAEQVRVTRIDAREDMETQLALVRWIFLGMAALVLLIGVAGILNVGLATVGERVEEFALRRAVGTPRLLLAAIVLAETLLTGLCTAGAAIGVGVVGLRASAAVIGHPALDGVAFPWQAGVAGVVAGLVAGVLGGLVPAIRAARIPIAAVMRA